MFFFGRSSTWRRDPYTGEYYRSRGRRGYGRGYARYDDYRPAYRGDDRPRRDAGPAVAGEGRPGTPTAVAATIHEHVKELMDRLEKLSARVDALG